MQLDKMQKYTKSVIDSNFSEAADQLSSLQADYGQANYGYSAAASISDEAAGRIFDPNQKVVSSKTSNIMNSCKIRMAHDSAQAPQWQTNYQAWSAKCDQFNESVAAQSAYNQRHNY